jgi:hypothetical protein
VERLVDNTPRRTSISVPSSCRSASESVCSVRRGAVRARFIAAFGALEPGGVWSARRGAARHGGRTETRVASGFWATPPGWIGGRRKLLRSACGLAKGQTCSFRGSKDRERGSTYGTCPLFVQPCPPKSTSLCCEPVTHEFPLSKSSWKETANGDY